MCVQLWACLHCGLTCFSKLLHIRTTSLRGRRRAQCVIMVAEKVSRDRLSPGLVCFQRHSPTVSSLMGRVKDPVGPRLSPRWTGNQGSGRKQTVAAFKTETRWCKMKTAGRCIPTTDHMYRLTCLQRVCRPNILVCSLRKFQCNALLVKILI